MVQWYMRKNHCSEEEALEWIEYNTEGACGFEGSPIILEVEELDSLETQCYNKNRGSDMIKVKEFFNNTVVKAVSWCGLVASVASLIIGGATETEINNGVGLTFGIVGTVSALIIFITGKLKK